MRSTLTLLRTYSKTLTRSFSSLVGVTFSLNCRTHVSNLAKKLDLLFRPRCFFILYLLHRIELLVLIDAIQGGAIHLIGKLAFTQKLITSSRRHQFLVSQLVLLQDFFLSPRRSEIEERCCYIDLHVFRE